MTAKILFVDDDPTLLRSIERNLCMDYDIELAESGSEGLTKIASTEAYSVVVSDMRMPKMNGIQFINEARKIAPDTVYIMLTGNQDVNTATQAVNEGNVFRFLNKPCQMEDIRKTLELAQRQYELVVGEKQLLHRTFVGAVGVLTDVIESLQPNLVQQSGRVGAVVKELEGRLDIPERWESRLAGRLAFLGLALLPDPLQRQFCFLSPVDPEAPQLMGAVAESSARLIERIPRLDDVAQIIRLQLQVDGQLPSGGDERQRNLKLAAALLRIGTHWAALIGNGMNNTAAVQELKQAFPKIDPRLCIALSEMDEDASSPETVEVDVDHLREGMIIATDVVSPDGALLLRKGRRLTRAVIEKIHLHSSDSRKRRMLTVVKLPEDQYGAFPLRSPGIGSFAVNENAFG
ncbi:MAG: response regulator [Pirellulales bacterium]|nr:response regulator [Pirellulales bacterium]